MQDIFDAKILCKKCNAEMKPGNIIRRGFQLRVVQCPVCNDTIVHPSDLNNMNQYNLLRNKTYTVKLRMVGNSHAISIPKEILEFMNEMEKNMEKHMSDMVRLCFEDFGKLRVEFISEKDIRKKEQSSEDYDPEIEDDDFEEKNERKLNKKW